MFHALPQTIALDLVERINHASVYGCTEFELMHLKRDVKKIELAGEYVEAQQYYGMISAIEGKLQDVDKHFNSALTASGRHPRVLLNYAIALKNLHGMSLATDVAMEAVDKSPDDLSILKETLSISVSAYRVDDAKKVIAYAARLKMLNQQEVDELMQQINYRESMMESSGASSEEINSRLALATLVAIENGYPPTMVIESFCDGISFQEFCLNTSDIEVLMKVESAIHERIASEPFSAADNMLAISCVSTSEIDDVREAM